jgi:hypothetical protein
MRNFVTCILYQILSEWLSKEYEWKKRAYKVLVEDPEGKRPLGGPKHRWKDNIKTDLKEMGWDHVD